MVRTQKKKRQIFPPKKHTYTPQTKKSDYTERTVIVEVQ